MVMNAAPRDPAQQTVEAVATASHTDARLLDILSGVAEALRSVVNAHTEIVVHDLTNPEASIVSIVNGHVSGRQVNQSLLAGPTDDLAFDKMVRRGATEEPNAVVVLGNYTSHARDGRSLRSASMIIYGENRQPVAAFCLNVDATAGEQTFRQLQALLFPADTAEAEARSDASDETTMEDLVSEIVEQAIGNSGAAAERMTKQEKMAAVGAMHARGLFLIRGSIERVAKRLGTTKFTIYNYLDELGLK